MNRRRSNLEFYAPPSCWTCQHHEEDGEHVDAHGTVRFVGTGNWFCRKTKQLNPSYCRKHYSEKVGMADEGPIQRNRGY